jgi:hypothetical protein
MQRAHHNHGQASRQIDAATTSVDGTEHPGMPISRLRKPRRTSDSLHTNPEHLAVKKFALPNPPRESLGTSQSPSPRVSTPVRDWSLGRARRYFSSHHETTNNSKSLPAGISMFRYGPRWSRAVSLSSAITYRPWDIPVATCFVISLHLHPTLAPCSECDS